MIDFKFLFAKGCKILLNRPALRQCRIDKSSRVCSGSELSEVEIGKYSYIGNRCFLVRTKIGNYCSIADKCGIGGAMHPIHRVSSSPVFHSGRNVLKKNFANFNEIQTPTTQIGNDVWIGMGALIKAGISIGDGAVIGMGSVVTKDVPAFEIWAGNPARKISERFDKNITDSLCEICWWDWDDEEISKKAYLFDNIEQFIEMNK